MREKYKKRFYDRQYKQ